MSNKFLTSAQNAIQISDVVGLEGILNDVALLPISVNDVSGLQQILDNVITNPLNAILKCSDVETDDYFSINDELDKIQNITSASPNETNITGILNITEISLENVYSPNKSTYINLNENTISVNASELLYNGNDLISNPYTGNFEVVGDIKSNNLVSSRIFDESKSISIDLDSTTANIIAPYLKFNNENVIYQNYPGSIFANAFAKIGGNANQYLMANGSVLTQSAVSGNSNYYLYTNQTAITPPPSNGHVRFNNINQLDATEVYISHLTSDNIDIDIFFNNLSVLNTVYLQDKNNSLNYIEYNIIASPILLPNQYISIQVSYKNFGGNGNSTFGNNTNLLVSFFNNNEEIDTRLSNLEISQSNINTKIQNQTAILGTTTLAGITDIATLETDLIRDRVNGTSAQIFLSPGLIEIVCNTLQYNSNEVLYTPYPAQIQAISFKKTGGISSEFLKADGSIDSTIYTPRSTTQWITTTGNNTNINGIGGLFVTNKIVINSLGSDIFLKGDGTQDANKYNNIQFQLVTAPASLTNSIIETSITGTGLTSNNMGLIWLDQVNNARKIEIFGTIRHLASANLTIRFRYTGGTILLAWPITLSATAINTVVPFQIGINYRIGTPNLYITNGMLSIAGAIPTSSYMVTNSQASVFTNTLPYTVTAQWGAASPNNQITINDFKIINRLII